MWSSSVSYDYTYDGRTISDLFTICDAVNFYTGLAALGTVGVVGIIFFNKLSTININRVLDHRYEISSSFRQEL